MTKRTLVVTASLFALVFVAAPSEAARRGRIELTAVRASAQTIAHPPGGRSGDVSTEFWRLNNRHGHRVGKLSMVCRWISAVDRLCFGEIRMPNGQIMLGGASPTRLDAFYAVLGGTGIYEGVGGAARLRAIGLKRSALVVSLA